MRISEDSTLLTLDGELFFENIVDGKCHSGYFKEQLIAILL